MTSATMPRVEALWTSSESPLDGFVIPPTPGWMGDARCVDVDLEVMFPPTSRGVQGDYTAALALCRGCPVRRECLDFALADGHDDGVWGGITDKQRRHVRPLDRP